MNFAGIYGWVTGQVRAGFLAVPDGQLLWEDGCRKGCRRHYASREWQTAFHWHFWRLTIPSQCSQCISNVQQHQENFSVKPMWLMLSLKAPVNHTDSSLLINSPYIITSLILQSHRVISVNIALCFYCTAVPCPSPWAALAGELLCPCGSVGRQRFHRNH